MSTANKMEALALPTRISTTSTTTESAATSKKPIIIGLYGLPGSGKTSMLNALQTTFDSKGPRQIHFIEGSSLIAKCLPEGVTLETFKKLSEEGKFRVRTEAITQVAKICDEKGCQDPKPAVVTGHFSFWSGKKAMTKIERTGVLGAADLAAYSHILYLETEPEELAERRENDPERQREPLSVDKLREWQKVEMDGLKKLCHENRIVFETLDDDHELTGLLIEDFAARNSEHDEEIVASELDRIVSTQNGKSKSGLKSMLVIDADKTLASQDASDLFWYQLKNTDNPLEKTDNPLDKTENPLDKIFGSSLKYTYTAFRQAAAAYGEIDAAVSKEICANAASEITLRPEFKQLLSEIVASASVGVVVATCGITAIWRQVLDREGLHDVPIVGGKHLAEKYIVSPETKANLVKRLRDHHKLHVCAVGDSFVDVKMLIEADVALVVVGTKDQRSNSVEAELKRAIREDGLRARQVLFPPEVEARLSPEELPTLAFNAAEFLAELDKPHGLGFKHATGKTASLLLTTKMRKATVRGMALMNAHRKVGYYLATKYVSKIVGVEAFDMKSVQGNTTKGHRLLNEAETCIIPLMRGGEPMALGVWEAFPAAMFFHAKHATDIEPMHLEEKRTVILVDGVINSGKSILEFVRRIRSQLSRQIRIVVVAGVVQEEAAAEGGLLEKGLAGLGEVSLVALRTSKNKFTGTGGTDTGHRLFNTTHLE